MKSMKPGRGPSFMSGLASTGAALLGVFWTIFAAAMGAGFMAPFGLIFIGIGVANAIYTFKNATSQNRCSSFDIVDGSEEPDPLNTRCSGAQSGEAKDSTGAAEQLLSLLQRACRGGFAFCSRCGKQLP